MGGKSSKKGGESPYDDHHGKKGGHGHEDEDELRIKLKHKGTTRRIRHYGKNCCCGVWVIQECEETLKCAGWGVIAFIVMLIVAGLLFWYYLTHLPGKDYDLDICGSQTGVTCTDSSKCGEFQECFGGSCFCRVGFCAIEGKCRHKCEIETEGTCTYLPCDKSRGPTDCLGFGLKKCYCQDGYCKINNQCRDIRCNAVDTGVKCTAGTCPSSVGPAECIAGTCACTNNTCLQNKVCVELAALPPRIFNSSMPDIEPVESLSQWRSTSWEAPVLTFLGTSALLLALLSYVAMRVRSADRTTADLEERFLAESPTQVS